jgi:hypothetical protein
MVSALAAVALLALAAAPLVDYRVTAVGPTGAVLDVEARGADPTFTLDPAALEYVSSWDGGYNPLRYRYRLEDAPRELHSRKYAFADGEGLYAAASTWLMHPPEPAADARFHLDVKTPRGLEFVTGLHRGADAGYEAPLWVLDDAPWSGFAAFRLFRDELDGAVVETAIAPGALELKDAQVRAWVLRSVKLVAAFYGRFPVPRVAVMVLPGQGSGVGFGTAMGNGGAAVLVWLGAHADEETVMRHDWVLPHELTHFALPNLSPRYSWLEEGAATYVEPLTRARLGELTADDFWAQMIEKLPLGLPVRGDRGLDHTPTWGRTYWGGALFCFVADVELRKKGKSLDDALKGIVAAGGTQEVRWPIERTLAAGDAATGTQVLTQLHQKLGAAPGDVDLKKLFKQLGVALEKGRVRYDDAAPLAAARRAMTAPAPASAGSNQ